MLTLGSLVQLTRQNHLFDRETRGFVSIRIKNRKKRRSRRQRRLAFASAIVDQRFVNDWRKMSLWTDYGRRWNSSYYPTQILAFSLASPDIIRAQSCVARITSQDLSVCLIPISTLTVAHPPQYGRAALHARS